MSVLPGVGGREGGEQRGLEWWSGLELKLTSLRFAWLDLRQTIWIKLKQPTLPSQQHHQQPANGSCSVHPHSKETDFQVFPPTWSPTIGTCSAVPSATDPAQPARPFRLP